MSRLTRLVLAFMMLAICLNTSRSEAASYAWKVYKKIQPPQEITALTSASYEFTLAGYNCEVSKIISFGEKSKDNKWQMRTLTCKKGDWKVETSASCGGRHGDSKGASFKFANTKDGETVDLLLECIKE